MLNQVDYHLALHQHDKKEIVIERLPKAIPVAISYSTGGKIVDVALLHLRFAFVICIPRNNK